MLNVAWRKRWGRWPLLVFALAAGAFAVFAQGQWVEAATAQLSIERAADHAAQKQRKQATDKVEGGCANLVPAKRSDCAYQARQPYESVERSIRDLESQQISALWNRVLGETAIVGMLVGISGLILVFTTFWETRKGNEISRRAMENQNRAWLEVDITDVSELSYDEAGKVFRLRVNFRTRNIGGTIARSVNASARLIQGGIFLDQEPVRKFIADARNRHGRFLSFDIFPEQDIDHSHTIEFDPQTLPLSVRKYGAGPISLCLGVTYGTIYDDADATPHETCRIFEVGRRNDSGAGLLTIVEPKTVPLDELRIQPDHLLQGSVT